MEENKEYTTPNNKKRKFNRSLFSSTRENWQTPNELYQALDAEFNFDFDPCPNNPKFDGLSVEWGLRNYVNPPYGRKIGQWFAKAFEEREKGRLSVFLVPSRTDTIWWHKYAMQADDIRFIKGRLKFRGAKNVAPFPSVLLVFR